MSSQRYLHCLFAEDVRQELGGQMSIIGMYQGGVQVATVPLTLVKFAVLATLFLPKGDVPKNVVLELRLGDSVLHRLEPPSSFISEGISAEEKKEGEAFGFALQFIFAANNFTIAEAGKLEVWATIDESRLKGNSLVISVATPDFEESVSAPL